MIALFVAATVAAPPVADAERRFAAAAQTTGQWTAFRAFADPHAIMFAPGPVEVQSFLAGRKDPAQPVMWWPARTISSCDGALAVSTGPWLRKASHGSFTTIWRRRADGWKYLYDSGRDTPATVAAGEAPVAVVASCTGHPAEPAPRTTNGPVAADLIVQYDDRMPGGALPADRPVGDPVAGGASPDRTLVWSVDTLAGGEPGAHRLRVWRWDGRRMLLALIDMVGVAAP